MLAIIEDEQAIGRGEPRNYCVFKRLTWLLVCLAGGRQGMADECRIGEGRQIGPPDAIWIDVTRGDRHLTRQAGLATTADTYQGQQSCGRQDPAERADILPAPDEAGQRARQRIQCVSVESLGHALPRCGCRLAPSALP